MYRSDFAKGIDGGHGRPDLVSAQAEELACYEHVLPPGEVQVETHFGFEQRPNTLITMHYSNGSLRGTSGWAKGIWSFRHRSDPPVSRAGSPAE